VRPCDTETIEKRDEPDGSRDAGTLVRRGGISKGVKGGGGDFEVEGVGDIIRPDARDLIVLGIFLGPIRSAALDFGCVHRLRPGCCRARTSIFVAAALRSGPSLRKAPRFRLPPSRSGLGRGMTWEEAANYGCQAIVFERGSGEMKRKKGQRTQN
jgi:hypothetical protein